MIKIQWLCSDKQSNNLVLENFIWNDEGRASRSRRRERECAQLGLARASLGACCTVHWFWPLWLRSLPRVLQKAALLPHLHDTLPDASILMPFCPLYSEHFPWFFSLYLSVPMDTPHTGVSLTLGILSTELGSCLKKKKSCQQSQAHHSRWHCLCRRTVSALKPTALTTPGNQRTWAVPAIFSLLPALRASSVSTSPNSVTPQSRRTTCSGAFRTSVSPPRSCLRSWSCHLSAWRSIISYFLKKHNQLLLLGCTDCSSCQLCMGLMAFSITKLVYVSGVICPCPCKLWKFTAGVSDLPFILSAF